jgi:hypothetical protein
MTAYSLLRLVPAGKIVGGDILYSTAQRANNNSPTPK